MSRELDKLAQLIDWNRLKNRPKEPTWQEKALAHYHTIMQEAQEDFEDQQHDQ